MALHPKSYVSAGDHGAAFVMVVQVHKGVTVSIATYSREDAPLPENNILFYKNKEEREMIQMWGS